MWLFRPSLVALAALVVAACSAPSFVTEGTGGAGGGNSDSGASAAGGGSGAAPESRICADSKCEHRRCAPIPLITHPWRGPLRMLAAGDTSCPATYPESIAQVGVVDVPAGTCQKCVCTAGAQIACGTPKLDLYTSDDCTGTSLATKSLSTPCVSVSFSPTGPKSFGYKKPAPSGSCASSDDGAQPNIPAAGLKNLRALCQGVAGTGVSTCALDVSQPVCVATPLSDVCPSGYPKKTTLSEGPVSDPRSCSPCGCGPVTGSCDGTVVRRNTKFCSAVLASASDSNGGCSDPQSPESEQHFSLDTAPKPNAQCAPTGGTVTGTPAASNAWTICCTS